MSNISDRIIVPRKTLSLPKTGQTTEYQAGDDGTTEAGQNSPAVRYVDNLNGTVSDLHTGLMWVQEPQKIVPGTVVGATLPLNQIKRANVNYGDGAGVWKASTAGYVVGDVVTNGGLFYACTVTHTSAAAFATDLAADKWRETVWKLNATDLTTPAVVAWGTWITYCNALEYAGYAAGSWRMPNVLELASLVDFGGSSPAINALFANTKSLQYFSSTTHNGFTTYAWHVNFDYGGISADLKTTATYYTRPVRGGIS